MNRIFKVLLALCAASALSALLVLAPSTCGPSAMKTR